MQRSRRIAAAAAASTLVVAGTVTAFALTAGPASADGQIGSCSVSATSSQCAVADPTGSFTTFAVDNPVTMSLALSVSAKTDAVSLSWTSNCYGTVAFAPASGSQAYNDGVGTDPTGTSFNLAVDQQDMAAKPTVCYVTAKLTANPALTGTDTGQAKLSVTTQAAPTPTSASPTPSPTPSASQSSTPPSGGGMTGSVKGFDGKCMDDMKNSAKLRATIAIWSCNSRDKAQTWTYQNGAVKHNGLCLNAKGNAKSGSKVILWTCNGAANETWVFNTINHQVLLKANGFSVCLDDPGYSTKNGTQLMVYTCHNTPNQHWSVP